MVLFSEVRMEGQALVEARREFNAERGGSGSKREKARSGGSGEQNEEVQLVILTGGPNWWVG